MKISLKKLKLIFLILIVGQNQIIEAKSIFIKSSIKQLPFVINKVKNSFKEEYIQLFSEILKRTSSNFIERDL